MSVASVNTAVWNWLKATPGLTTLYEACPVRLLGDAWQSNSEPGTPAFLEIAGVTESRITVPAVNGGQKSRTYQFAIVCLYQWLIPNDVTATGTGQTDGWVSGQLALIDSILARIEADPQFGTNGAPVFEAGNQPDGVKVGRGEPVLDPAGGKVMAWCHVEFQVTEIVQA
ncbi:MAG: hypothetical protein ACTHJM_16040 [Marmoricola sp.]